MVCRLAPVVNPAMNSALVDSGPLGRRMSEPFVQQLFEPCLVGVRLGPADSFVDLQQFGEGRLIAHEVSLETISLGR